MVSKMLPAMTSESFPEGVEISNLKQEQKKFHKNPKRKHSLENS